MKQKQLDKHFLNLTGEYGVCSELAKRGITANLTLGNFKAVDVLFADLANKKIWTIEVKTTSSNRVVTGFFQKYHSKEVFGPNFWIIVKVEKNLISRYFILTHVEMGDIQAQRNGMKSWGKVNGVDNILLNHINLYENKWKTITSVITSP